MCGFLGLAGGKSPQDLLTCYYNGLLRLQTRGEESAGGSWSDGHRVDGTKGMGLVPVVFDREKIGEMLADNPTMLIGHTRYSTAGGSTVKNAQPHWLHDRKGRFAIALNGDVPDLAALRLEAMKNGNVYASDNDAEYILKQIDWFIDHEKPDWREDFVHGIRRMMETTRATYSGGLITGSRLYIFRDPWENRPLFIGRRGSLFVAASETTAFSIMHAEVERQVRGGEILIVQPNGEYRSIEGVPLKKRQWCVFEWIYFSRPDSLLPTGETCADFRRRQGYKLAACERSSGSPCCADCVMSVPDSGNFFTDGYSHGMGLERFTGMVRDNYVGRTFIDPDMDTRREKSERKYTVLPAVKTLNGGKRMTNAVWCDDSIVRLTTMEVLVGKIRKAGYEHIHLRISAPPIVAPCNFGIDMKTTDQLIAANLSVEQIRERLGVDSLRYLSLEKLDEVIREGGIDPEDCCRKCFGAPCAI
ncbi:MAG: amidophosphoribosyltransferase [Patescibacteria group bacterium]